MRHRLVRTTDVCIIRPKYCSIARVGHAYYCQTNPRYCTLDIYFVRILIDPDFVGKLDTFVAQMNKKSSNFLATGLLNTTACTVAYTDKLPGGTLFSRRFVNFDASLLNLTGLMTV